MPYSLQAIDVPYSLEAVRDADSAIDVPYSLEAVSDRYCKTRNALKGGLGA